MGVLGLLLVVGLVVYVPWRPTPLPPTHTENREEKYRQAAEAYRSPSLDVDEAETKEISALFDAYYQALRDRDVEALAGHFDFDRLAREAFRMGISKELTGDRRAVAKAIAGELPREYIAQAHILGCDRHRICGLKKYPDSEEAVVYIRELRAPNTRAKVRYWVRKEGDRWRIYDFEILEAGIRISTTMASVMNQIGESGLPSGLEADIELIRSATRSAAEGDLEGAHDTLEKVSGRHLPEELDAVRYLLMASVKLGLEDPAGALAMIERARALRPDTPQLDYTSASAYNQLGRYEDALKAVNAYLRLLGDDADALAEKGYALEGLERWTDALDAYALALDDDPDCLEAMCGFGRMLPDDQKGRLGMAFLKATKPKTLFEGLVSALIRDEYPSAARVVIAAYRTLDTTNPLADLSDAEVLLQEKKPQHAARMAKAVAARTRKGDVHDRALEVHLRAAREYLTPLKAYADAPDASYAMETLADSAVEDGDAERIRELIVAHHARKPNDLLLHVYNGEVHLIEKEYGLAEKAFAKAMSGAKRPNYVEWYRRRRVYALLLAGKGLAAYGKVGDRKKTFDQLAESFADKGDAKSLADLIGAHAKGAPNDGDIHLWQAEAHWIRKEYDKAANVLQKHRPAILKIPDNRFRYEDLLLRALVKSGRLTEAEKVARSSTERDGDPYYEAVVAGASGDVEWLRRSMRSCLKDFADYYTAADFYEDDDLGPILRSEKFKAIRKEFPPPKPATQPASE